MIDLGFLNDLTAPNCLPILPTHPPMDMREIKNFKHQLYLSEPLCYSSSVCSLFNTESTISWSQVCLCLYCFLQSPLQIPHGGLPKISQAFLLRMQMTVPASSLISSHYTIQRKENLYRIPRKSPKFTLIGQTQMKCQPYINPCVEDDVMS